MVSNKGLNSKEALDESTATNSSVTLSGIRREKETTPAGLDIEDYTPDPGDSDRQRRVKAHSPFEVSCSHLGDNPHDRGYIVNLQTARTDHPQISQIPES